MSDSKNYNVILPILGLAWCAVVMGAYYVSNTGYYAEKVGVFSKFLLGALN